MMNHSGWMGGGWMGGYGGGMWVWTVIGLMVVVLLAVLIKKVSSK
jgi:heme exporter protein D